MLQCREGEYCAEANGKELSPGAMDVYIGSSL